MKMYVRPRLFLQLLEQVEHLGLHRDVERRDRFVADDELGLDRQGPGDADPLPLAAGEFVRVAAQVARLQADFFEQRGGPVAALGSCCCRCAGSPSAR